MEIFEVEITEVLQRTVRVSADSSADALRKVNRCISDESIVLDENDYVSRDVKIVSTNS